MKPRQIVLASGNSGKLVELERILAPLGVEVLSQAQFNVIEAEETGLTFVENAILKARAACAQTGLPAIADDSGLEVDALLGAPGIHSARYSGSGDAGNNLKLLEALADVPPGQRTARFQCALVYLRHKLDPTPLICSGSWEGEILLEARGEGGFGYDPLFYVPEYDRSAAELDVGIKNQVSHRAQACAFLLTALKKQAPID